MQVSRRSKSEPYIVWVLVPLVFAAGCEDPVLAPHEIDDAHLHPGHELLDPEVDVVLWVPDLILQPGEEVSLYLENSSDGPIGFNLCFRALEYASDARWEMWPEERICMAIMNTLDPGEMVMHQTLLPDDLPQGDYRFRIALYFVVDDIHRDQVSTSFRVVTGAGEAADAETLHRSRSST